jgi:hypothetical protein
MRCIRLVWYTSRLWPSDALKIRIVLQKRDGGESSFSDLHET